MLGWFRKKKAGGGDRETTLNRQADRVQAEGLPDGELPDRELRDPAANGEPSSGSVDEPGERCSSAVAASSIPSTSEKVDAKGGGLFKRLRAGLDKTRESLVAGMDALLFGKKEVDAALLEDLEEILITADLGVKITHELLEEVKTRLARKDLSDPMALRLALKERIFSLLRTHDQSASLDFPSSGPLVIMVVGVNGVGKTTTIGKMAHKFVQAGRSPLLVAADTFRAAAVEQLKIWGERNGVEVVAQQAGADPSAVVYDALDYARKRNFDVVLVDTAGRLHTKVNLMEELKKIKRVIGKKYPGAPHEVMLVLDATTGQNSISQVKLFDAAAGVTGLALTKLDGTAKGGIVVNICHEFDIPIRFIGIGEGQEDLRDFDALQFIDALFD